MSHIQQFDPVPAGISAPPEGRCPRDKESIPAIPDVIPLQKIQQCADGRNPCPRHLEIGNDIPCGHLGTGDILPLQVIADEICIIVSLVAGHRNPSLQSFALLPICIGSLWGYRFVLPGFLSKNGNKELLFRMIHGWYHL
jgi:hypothetical protein